MRQVSYLYFTVLIAVPVIGGVAAGFLSAAEIVQFRDPAVIASSFGVLGGLLFAHAIFVFQLRVSYDATTDETAGPDAPMEDLRVRPLIDEMFAGVLYASLVALALTLITGGIAAVQDPTAVVSPVLFGITVGIGLHLFGCVLHVLSATTTAYQNLKRRSK